MNFMITHYFNKIRSHILTRHITYLSLFFSLNSNAQEVKKLSLQEAIKIGIENSKQIKLSQAKIDEAVSKYNQVKDRALPTGSTSLAYNHAEIPTSTFQLGGGSDPIHLPNRADAYIGTLSLQEVVFGGNRLRYAKESTDLLIQSAKLDAEKDKRDIVFNILNTYFNLYKLAQSQNVVKQNLEDIDKQIKQTKQFFEQGIVTKNDLLRFQLQRSNVQLTGLDLKTNSDVVNYNLNILLGFKDNTVVQIDELKSGTGTLKLLSNYIDSALQNREEIKSLALRGKQAETNIKSVTAEVLPTVLVGTNAYYINPSGKIIPPSNSFIAPITIGATLSWKFDGLWLNKNKVAEAKIQRSEVQLSNDLFTDQVKTQVNQDYQNYNHSISKIQILETSIEQARENNRILESKYRNNVASVTERIDAETQLYQTLINYEIAKADAQLAYFTLLKSSGTLSINN
ncbi:MAG: transporter [Sphingobacteriales bacterium]|nr:transporter [Sphingobacteriales bacterium]